MKASEIRELKDEEIVHEVRRLRRELYTLRSQAVTEKLENPRQFGVIRKDIARLLTEQTARRNQAKTAGAAE
ncbi:50S ribosomal protein L29 [Mucisphaera calidilacus]|uniref:Large ribosomal subunit protein uL29 n=2 Tax=Mucisphaera calidilacus TaxID=2527982 RepID=A0A518BXT6_9BACT|nr:50S ribosomal protein L29 [Mucisphaera calidilacus]